MTPNGRAYMHLERKDALARVLHDLHTMLVHLRDAHYHNHAFALGLELPSEHPLIEQIGACVQTYQQSPQPAESAP